MDHAKRIRDDPIYPFNTFWIPLRCPGIKVEFYDCSIYHSFHENSVLSVESMELHIPLLPLCDVFHDVQLETPGNGTRQIGYLNLR